MVARHLGIHDTDSIHVLDLELGAWVTHFRSSPPIIIRPNRIVHTKNRETDLPMKIALSYSTSERAYLKAEGSSPNIKRKASVASIKDVVVDLTYPDSPSTKRAKIEPTQRSVTKLDRQSTPPSPLSSRVEVVDVDDLEDVGAIPARLSSFPARTVDQMAPRLAWIASSETPENVEFRFKKVFSCAFKRSTYYKHQSAWKWMRDNNLLNDSRGSDLWAPLVNAANEAIKGERNVTKQERSGQSERAPSIEL